MEEAKDHQTIQQLQAELEQATSQYETEKQVFAQLRAKEQEVEELKKQVASLMTGSRTPSKYNPFVTDPLVAATLQEQTREITQLREEFEELCQQRQHIPQTDMPSHTIMRLAAKIPPLRKENKALATQLMEGVAGDQMMYINALKADSDELKGEYTQLMDHFIALHTAIGDFDKQKLLIEKAVKKHEAKLREEKNRERREKEDHQPPTTSTTTRRETRAPPAALDRDRDREYRHHREEAHHGSRFGSSPQVRPKEATPVRAMIDEQGQRTDEKGNRLAAQPLEAPPSAHPPSKQEPILAVPILPTPTAVDEEMEGDGMVLGKEDEPAPPVSVSTPVVAPTPTVTTTTTTTANEPEKNSREAKESTPPMDDLFGELPPSKRPKT